MAEAEGRNEILVPLLDPRRDFERLKPELLAAAERVLSSGRYILGEEVAAFEQAMADWLGTSNAIGVASGTDALWLALRALGVEGKKVVTTAFTFFATASAIVNSGAEPVLVDVDPDTFNIDVGQVGEVLAGRSPAHRNRGLDPREIAAIVPVHLFGLTADMEPLLELGRQYGIPVVEDAAQATGSTYDGKKAGTIGEVGCFSFFPTKNLAGFGDGGLVTTEREDLAETIRLLRAHGARKKYQHDIIGTNSRLDSLQAALLSVKLEHLEEDLEARRLIAARYDETLSGISSVKTPVIPPNCHHTFHQYTIRVKDGRRDALCDHLAQRGIQTMKYYPLALHQQPALGHLGYSTGEAPVAEAAAREVLSLPVFPGLIEEEVTRVVRAVAEGLGVTSDEIRAATS